MEKESEETSAWIERTRFLLFGKSWRFLEQKKIVASDRLLRRENEGEEEETGMELMKRPLLMNVGIVAIESLL